MSLTLDKIRAHLRIEPGCEEPLIELYARAAIEAAERYSCQKLAPGIVTDTFPDPYGSEFKLSSAPAGPVTAKVYIGSSPPQVYRTSVNGRRAYLPVRLSCGVDRLELVYRIGPDPDDIKGVLMDANPMIELGVLKFVAYAYTHRGDDPNCWATDSGAVGLWTSQKPVAF